MSSWRPLTPALSLGERISRINSRIEPMNRTAAVLKASRSAFGRAVAGLRHSRGPVHWEDETISRSLADNSCELNPVFEFANT